MGRTQMTHTLKQKIALAVALAVAVALVFVSVVAGVAIYAMSSGESNYGENEYPRSAQSYGIGTRVIPEQLDQWEAYFGQGTAEIRADAVDAGVDTLAVALERVPKDADSDEPEPTGAEKLEDFTPECRVRINLAVGQEILGDRLYAAGYFDEARATFEGRPRLWHNVCPRVSLRSSRSKIPTTRRRTRKNSNRPRAMTATQRRHPMGRSQRMAIRRQAPGTSSLTN